jgi:MFS family permease
LLSLFDWLSTDGKLLLAAKIVRIFAYGLLSIILAIYLKLVGFDEFLIGIILTTTLLNSVIFTQIASFYADRIGRRKLLVIYAALMSTSAAQSRHAFHQEQNNDKKTENLLENNR